MSYLYFIGSWIKLDMFLDLSSRFTYWIYQIYISNRRLIRLSRFHLDFAICDNGSGESM